MDGEKLNKDDIICKEGEYETADLSLKPIDVLFPVDAARRAPTDPVIIALWLRGRIIEEATAGLKALYIPAYMGLPKILDALKELGYTVRQERPDGAWRISWEEGA